VIHHRSSAARGAIDLLELFCRPIDCLTAGRDRADSGKNAPKRAFPALKTRPGMLGVSEDAKGAGPDGGRIRAFSKTAQTGISLLSHPFRRKKRKGWGTEVRGKSENAPDSYFFPSSSSASASAA
jgi:hypothetical protein